MWKEKKYPYGLFFLALIACLAAGYFISGIFADGQPALSDIPDKLNGIMRDPFKNYWNEKSLPCMGGGFIGWLYFISQYTFRNRNFQFGIENGAERWADPKEIKLGDKDPKKNWRLSENVEVSKTILSNNNILLVGSPGTGKSTGFFIPELLKASASFVVMDIKGELLSGYGNYLEEQGVRVQSLNLKEPEKSNQFNPFVFIHKDIDLIRVITSIQESTTSPDAQKGEPFWDEGVSLYLMALMYYVWLESPVKNLPEVLRLANKEEQTVDKDGTTELEILMERLTLGPRGKEHPAYKNYRKLKGGHEETVRSIILMVNAKLRLLEVPELARIFTENELDIDSLGTGKNWDGKTKTAIFLVLPEQDKSFDFVLGMVYTQIFNRLIELADTYFCGPLPVPVEFYTEGSIVAKIDEEGEWATRGLSLRSPKSRFQGDRSNYMMDLGYREDGVKRIRLGFGNPGKYSFEKLEVICQEMEPLNQWAAQRNQDTIEGFEADGNKVRCSITLTEPKAVVFSIPYNKGWSLTVDGEKAELKQANGMFMAAELTEGSHEITLNYETPYIRVGVVLTAAGVILTAGIFLYYKKRRKN